VNVKELTAACLMSTAGALVYLISPVLVGSAMDSLVISSDDAGLLIASYFAGYTLINLTAVTWLHRTNVRHVAGWAAVVFIGGLLAGTAQETLLGSAAALFVSGTGAGLLYGISVGIIGRSPKADRYFGIALSAQLLFGSVLLFVAPAVLAPKWGYDGILIGTAAYVAVLCTVVGWSPKTIEKDVRHDDNETPSSLALVMGGVVAVLIWFTGYSGAYAFVERIGVEGGVTSTQIGLVLSLTIITGMTGALGAAWLGDRFGRILPHFVGAVGTAVTFVLLYEQPDLVRFALAMVCLTLSLNFWLAYMLGAVTALDTQGRYAVLTTAALGLGATFGPAIAGGLVSTSGFPSMFIFASAATLAGLLMITGILRKAT